MPDETSDRLAQLIARIFALSSPEAATTLSRTDGSVWDSLRHMELIFAVEDEFGIRFPEEDLTSIRTYSDLLARVRSLQSS